MQKQTQIYRPALQTTSHQHMNENEPCHCHTHSNYYPWNTDTNKL